MMFNINNYEDFLSFREEILERLKKHVENTIKNKDGFKFNSYRKDPSQSKTYSITIYDEIYRVVVGRMKVNDLSERLLKTLRKKTVGIDSTDIMVVEEISIAVEESDGLADSKYIITFTYKEIGEHYA